MIEPRLRRRPASNKTQPPLMNPKPTGIQVHWLEDAGIAIEIQYRQRKLAAKFCATPWKRECRPGHDGRLAPEAETQNMFISKPKRQAF